MALQHFLCGLTVVIILSSKECGLAPKNTRITGGEDASPGSWPWQLPRQDHSSLVASHLGQHSQSGPNSHEVTRGVQQATCHPSYSFPFNDICLLKLSAPVNLTDYIFPVCLASENSTFYTGVRTWVTGWGRIENGTLPNILQEVNVAVVGNNECRCSYGSIITKDVICTGLRDGGKGPCFGDGGGAMVAKKDSSWFQVGIVSFIRGCALPNFPAGFTRVSQYQEWIKSVTGSSQPGFVTFISSGVDSDANFTCPTILPPTTTPSPRNVTVLVSDFTRSSKPPPTTSPSPPPVTDRDGNSVFDSGENVIHFSHSTHFISLCILVLSLFALLSDA
ncbi:hypothetical protein L3Q82_003969 [Scortum barcoo]|uniref:Uncharacterized protein n=1 Tax=Scortum barcoo TaxID=214431 RepID=A0ACB8X6B8_9TELE|nr:hypothetical protein L3Q82_003969 [Scortum barcoo]